MQFTIPESLKTEHEELHDELAKATHAGGRIGEAATAVAKLMHPHFIKEDEYALPPLGLLAAAATGLVVADMRAVLVLTDKLKADLPNMLEEHRSILSALERLIGAAKEENKPEFARFAEKLMHHAQVEEDVMYPAALLVGEFIRLKLRAGDR
jgi:hypothetical protein